ncbi:MAG TPA: Imm40 family immunity protein [Longimicrobium sp.]|nr:Imm40 family immunity protein [Longimicrobium sp.]
MEANPIFERLPEAIRSRGRSLQDIGLNEIAWPLSMVGEVLRSFTGLDVAVLGGDVYEVLGATVTPSYENWFCERLPEETLAAYSTRSRRTATEFVEKIASRADTERLVSLVVSDSADAGY